MYIKELPFPELEQIETKKVLKKVASANRYLAELKGVVVSIPNEAILINTLSLQEAKHSSEIENIITTHDDLFKSEISQDIVNPAAKEVRNYTEALIFGFQEVRKNKIIRLSDILRIQELLEKNKAGFRKVPGTTLKDGRGKVIYEPPQHPDEIESLMNNLAEFINDNNMSELDPLVKMAVVASQQNCEMNH